jgi:hypothetical protein
VKLSLTDDGVLTVTDDAAGVTLSTTLEAPTLRALATRANNVATMLAAATSRIRAAEIVAGAVFNHPTAPASPAVKLVQLPADEMGMRFVVVDANNVIVSRPFEAIGLAAWLNNGGYTR